MTFLLSPWRGVALWRDLAREALDIPLGLVFGIGVGLLVGLSVGFALTFVVAIPALWLSLSLAEQLGRFERARAAALLDLDLASPHHSLTPGRWWSRPYRMLASASRWREIAYLVLACPILGAFGAVVLGVWAFALVLIALPAYVGHLPGREADFGVLDVHAGGGAVGALFVGLVVVILIAPHATVGLARLDRGVVRLLLGPRRRAELEARVEALSISRDAAVDSAEAERRRIERDLHDGAQQRLVALALDLGRARERFDSDPERARQLVDDAHEEAKAALIELRDLARGIHPAVLAERGLDAALSAVVARCPVPVVLAIDIAPRPPAAIESTAYFVVAEALTNVAKHAKASRIEVSVARRDERLTVTVRDDGIGGAGESIGGGLAGLRERIAALGGSLVISSPLGGPTAVVMELPCAS
jgi:signal transduction histidine kinase